MKFIISFFPALVLTKVVFYVWGFDYLLTSDPFDFGKLLVDVSVFGFFYFISVLAYDYFFGEKLQLERPVGKPSLSKKRKRSI
ncbi:hypothetical protein [Pseudoalteromonas piscicida]|uniref:Uncharacterized protein n=1 Tax=Pseudoalteromonas piscicida TaxID=43662 RepID=A0A2A5JU48_PSEO7|nr:hypothetical protein [Pseudoalteromonas piscicida]PCK33002.1 hypothetical protein CEX98_04095 [Pseudoalteromonas piscicida]